MLKGIQHIKSKQVGYSSEFESVFEFKFESSFEIESGGNR